MTRLCFLAAVLPPLTMFGAKRKLAPQERKPAPAFTLMDALDGYPVSLAEYQGRVVLLNFWATWCVPCRQEIPWFSEFHRTYGAQGFTVLGIAMDEEGAPAVRPYLKSHGVTYPTLLGIEAVAKQYGGVDHLPTTLLLDRQGRIAHTYNGPIKKSVCQSDIEELLKEEHPPQ